MSTYYIANNGSNNNPGTKEKPFATIKHAINQISAGDTLYIRGGTYYHSQSLWMGAKHSGTASNPTTIRSFPGEKVIIDGWDQTSGNLIDIEGDHISITGLTLKNSPGHGIGIWGGENIQIKNNTIRQTQKGGITAHGQFINGVETRVKNLLIQDNTVYQTNLSNQSRIATSGWDSGINASRADNVTIQNNKVYNNYGEGISLTLSSQGTVADNVVFDNYSVELYFDNVIESVLERNFVYNTGNSSFFRKICSSTCQWLPSVGIQLANERRNTSAYSLNNNTIRNNIVVGGRTGFAYDNYQTSRGMKNTLVANNTFYDAKTETIHIDSDDDTRNVTFSNNIFDQGGDRLVFFIPNQAGLKFQHNLLHDTLDSAKGSTPVLPGNTNQYGTPQFVNPGGTQASDYQLKSGSSAIDAGLNIALNSDFFGNQRPSGGTIDIGAYEAGATNLSTTGTENDDKINGSTGNDTLRGRKGNDSLYGYQGNDQLFGDLGNDLLVGGAGKDTVQGASGNDIARGGDDRDLIFGGSGADTLMGNNGNDSLRGGSGNDLLKGSRGQDFLSGGDGLDTLHGGTDSDTLYGDKGNDKLFGNAGNDILVGARALSTSAGQREKDQLTGGSGADLFVLGTPTTRLYDDGDANSRGTVDYALIRDFDASQGDRLQLQGHASAYRMGSTGPGLPSGMALYHTQQAQDELIAIIQTADPVTLANQKFV